MKRVLKKMAALLTPARKIQMQYIVALALGRLTRAIGVPRILTFHSIDDTPDPLLHQAPATFEEQIRYLSENGYKTAGISDMVSYLPSLARQKKLVFLTFDDGFENYRTTVAPILKKYDMTATFFISTAAVSETRQYPELPGLSDYRHIRMLSWPDILELSAQGFEIGSHTHSHVKIAQQTKSVAESEIVSSKLVLEEKLGRPVKSFAYPYGRSDAFAPWSRELLYDAGYAVGCTNVGKALTHNSDLLQLPRTNINGFDTLKHFVRKLNGDYDCIHMIWRK